MELGPGLGDSPLEPNTQSKEGAWEKRDEGLRPGQHGPWGNAWLPMYQCQAEQGIRLHSLRYKLHALTLILRAWIRAEHLKPNSPLSSEYRL